MPYVLLHILTSIIGMRRYHQNTVDYGFQLEHYRLSGKCVLSYDFSKIAAHTSAITVSCGLCNKPSKA